jgi:transcriptional regulator with XRE-family HTH domain
MTKQLRQSLAIGSPGRPVWQAVGRRVRDRRARLGIDAKRVALELSISPSTYEKYEAGSKQIPAFQLGQIAALLDVPVTWFFEDVEFGTEDGEAAPPRDAPLVFRVATQEHRVRVLADTFRNLDWEGQQHLLAIAEALSQPPRGGVASKAQSGPRKAPSAGRGGPARP